jgi:hypothetical protein
VSSVDSPSSSGHSFGVLTTIPIKQIHTYGTKAISLISASRIPLFLAVALILTQSLRGPAVNNPIIPPTTNAKFTNPTSAGVNKYGGAAKTCDCVKFRAKRQLAVNAKEKVAQKMMGKK